MAVDKASVAEKIFNLIKGRGYTVDMFNNNGERVIDPLDSTWMAIDDPNVVVKIDDSTSTIQYSANKNSGTADLRKDLKELAQKYLMNFDFKTFDGKLSPKSEQIFVAQNQEKEMSEGVMEGFGTMTGSSKTSYQGLDNVKLIVKHKAPVNEESRGARSRNIHSIFVQRGEERFKMAENNLKAARAMARHLQMGGETFDSVGTAITEMAAEQRKLSEFARYVTKRGLVNETNEEFVTLAKENVNNIKNTLDKLCGVKSYANAVESIQDMANVEILEDDLDLEAKFTETHFDSRVSDAMDSIKRSMNRRNSFESAIRTAIQKESFDNLKGLLKETGVVDFASPQARLSHQVSQMGHAAENPMLRNHLMGISKKIDAGQGLGQFEYDTIKSCLLSAREARVQEGNMYESAQQDWENFLEQYDIL
jgi:hypothetical protein